MTCPCVKKPDSYYLVENENPNAPVRENGRRGWYHPKRQGKIRGIVVHTAEALDDVGEDTSAEAVAKYLSTTDREASAHVVTDSDSVVQLLPDHFTAFHCRGHNSTTLGLEIGYRAGQWETRKRHERAIILVAACWSKEKARRYGIPAVRLTADEWKEGKSGFIAHADLDPERRTDPGPAFPWDRFLAYVRAPGQEGGEAVYPPASPEGTGQTAPASGLFARGRMETREDIVAVQTALTARGIYKGPLDGESGKATQWAVCEFQRRRGLSVDGIAGPKTLRALGLA